jgi:hypothetical protein
MTTKFLTIFMIVIVDSKETNKHVTMFVFGFCILLRVLSRLLEVPPRLITLKHVAY